MHAVHCNLLDCHEIHPNSALLQHICCTTSLPYLGTSGRPSLWQDAHGDLAAGLGHAVAGEELAPKDGDGALDDGRGLGRPSTGHHSEAGEVELQAEWGGHRATDTDCFSDSVMSDAVNEQSWVDNGLRLGRPSTGHHSEAGKLQTTWDGDRQISTRTLASMLSEV